MMRTHILLILIIGVPSLIAAPNPDKILIGVPLSSTGSYKEEGQQVKQGYDLWAHWVNARGGIRVGTQSKLVSLFYTDDESNVSINEAVTEHWLIKRHKVNFLLGPYSSELTAGTIKIAEANNIILVTGNAAADSLFKKANKVTFSIDPPASSYLYNAVTELANKGIKTIVVAHDNGSFSTAVAEGVIARATKLKLTVLARIRYPHVGGNVEQDPLKQTKAYTTSKKALIEAQKLKPDLFVGCGHFLDAQRFITAAQELKYNPKAMVLTVGPGIENFLEFFHRSALNGLVFPVLWSPNMLYKDPFFRSAQGFSTYYRTTTHSLNPPSYQTAAAFAAGLVLQTAIERARSLDTESVREQLKILDLQTFFGPVKFNDRGQNIARRPAVAQVQKGNSIIIGPPGAVTILGQLEYPKPKWPPYKPALTN